MNNEQHNLPVCIMGRFYTVLKVDIYKKDNCGIV